MTHLQSEISPFKVEWDEQKSIQTLQRARWGKNYANAYVRIEINKS